MSAQTRTATCGQSRRSGLAGLSVMLCLSVALWAAGAGNAGQGGPGAQTWQGVIEWRTGPALSTGKSTAESAALIDGLSTSGARHVVVHFDRPVGPALRSELDSAGVRLLSYLGDRAFFASIQPGQVDVAALAGVDALIDAQLIQRSWKLHPMLERGEVPAWTVVSPEPTDNPLVAVYVVFHRDVPLKAEAARVCLAHGAAIRSQVRTVNALVVELPYAEIPALADEDAVQWIEPALPSLTATNDSNRVITQADEVQSAPYGLDGSGVTVMVYDVGGVDAEHLDFAGRLTLGDGTAPSDHSTHVAGTVGGDGAESDGQYRGMAPGVSLVSYAFGWGAQGLPLYSDPGDIEQDYREAIHTFAIDIATNSIGTNVCRNGFNCEITGDYGVTSSVIDAIVRGGLGEPLIVLFANGNERSCDRCRHEGVHTPEGYHSTAPPACAKNHITVGAVNSNDDSVTHFTSWGPADDGRLKPDIIAPGCQSDDDNGVTSCVVGGGYEAHCGTSMATPTVAGLGALLLQDFRSQFPQQAAPRNATLKVLLAHNAADLGSAGPDYQSGYGSVRIRDTVDFTRTGSFFEEHVDQADSYSFLIRVDPGDVPLKVTLAWDDVPGTVNVEPALVNDLDLQVYDSAFNQYFPWTLDPDDPGAPAVQTQPDHLNNIEQVFVNAPVAGLWTVRVGAFNVPDGPQPFSICASPRLSRDCDANGVPDDEQIDDDPNLDCTGNGILDVCEPDCNENGQADSCDIADEISEDCDDNGVPDECEPDCNENGITDACDIRDGTSEDCDDDGVPDECQDTSADCNENGIWDACDIADGFSADENYNGVPDECEESRTVYVDDDGPYDPGPGDPLISDPDEDGSAEHPYDAILEAIIATLDGDTILVADGLYRGLGNTHLDFAGRAVVLRSMNGPEDCVIDCEGVARGFSFHSGETPATRVEGVTIRDAFDGFWGGGVFCENSSPTLANCVFEDNWAVVGGAVYIRWGDPIVTDCVFTGSWAVFGAAMFVTLDSSPTITNCDFSHNTAVLGGGAVTIYGGNSRLESCRFQENYTIGSDSDDGTGGGLLTKGGAPTLIGCIFSNNVVLGSGGGMYSEGESTPTLTNCAFIANGAFGPFADGGGICNLDSSPTLTGCTLGGNLAGRHGGGFSFANQSYPALTNCILWGNADRTGADESAQIHDNGGYPRVNYCCIEGLSGVLGGAGNIGADPLFVDPDQDDYHLTLGSPCINRGDPAFLPLPDEVDMDGDPRELLDRVDIGADEFLYQETDCNGNGIPDDQDIADGTSQDCNANEIPDECELDFGLAADCNANGIPDDCDIADGTSGDCSGNAVPDECEPDCNENGEPDDCDIVNEVSQDCDENGVPDECEPDCNQNEVTDACDIAIGSSTDFNNNAIPDECEESRTIYIDDDGPHDPGPGVPWYSDPNEDGTAEHPFDAIQEGIDAAIPGDVVMLRDGVYAGTGNKNLEFHGRAITVRGEHGPAACIINCEQRGRAFYFADGESTAARVDGLTITNGSMNWGGGAIYCDESSPTITNCILVGNTSRSSIAYGGGALLTDACSPVIANCLIAGNWGKRGGGIRCVGSGRPEIINCTITGNHAEQGGAIWCGPGSAATITNTILWENVADTGPQISLVGPAALLWVRYCDVEGGRADVHVEGVTRLVWGSGNLDADPRLVAGPSGTWTDEPVYDLLTRQTTLMDANAAWAENALLGKLLQPDAEFYPQGLILANTATTITVWGDYSTLGLPEVPYQVHDNHFKPCSPCIDAADNTAVPPALTADLDGKPRFVDDPCTADIGNGTPPIADIGSYEYQADCPGDLNGDRVVDVCDLMILLSAYGVDDGGDLNCDGVTDRADLGVLLAHWGEACP